MDNHKQNPRATHQSAYKDAVKVACVGTGVDLDTLLGKLPPFPDPSNEEEMESYFLQLRASSDGMSEEEMLVMQRASALMVESLWSSIKTDHSDLPEFKE